MAGMSVPRQKLGLWALQLIWETLVSGGWPEKPLEHRVLLSPQAEPLYMEGRAEWYGLELPRSCGFLGAAATLRALVEESPRKKDKGANTKHPALPNLS